VSQGGFSGGHILTQIYKSCQYQYIIQVLLLGSRESSLGLTIYFDGTSKKERESL
jgi:hypothetical protein